MTFTKVYQLRDVQSFTFLRILFEILKSSISTSRTVQSILVSELIAVKYSTYYFCTSINSDHRTPCEWSRNGKRYFNITSALISLAGAQLATITHFPICYRIICLLFACVFVCLLLRAPDEVQTADVTLFCLTDLPTVCEKKKNTPSNPFLHCLTLSLSFSLDLTRSTRSGRLHWRKGKR